ncbi:MAG: T9SS C-terminal target domain-containing protein [Flavobacteriia bacterium]|nr:T9SS C-terminal target domain-containing protein [Flavobacteriia bacterium]NBP28239.1 T9SS C-terminal target domain-containing protein [Flavobacteriia bacterium]
MSISLKAKNLTMKFPLFILLLVTTTLFAQTSFTSLYQQYPSVPKGFVEAYAFTHTRMHALEKSEPLSCSNIPQPFGILGLFDEGNHYFIENAKKISQLSGISVQTMKASEEQQLAAFAKTCEILIQHPINQELSEGETIYQLMAQLSEIPRSNAGNLYAFESSVFSIFQFLQDEEMAAKYGFPQRNFDLKHIFGDENYEVLSSSHIQLQPNRVESKNGAVYNSSIASIKSADYGPALWNPAPNCNFSSRNGTAISAVTIHTVQGSYSGAISWGLNCNAQVSYHYVIRSSDGQVTQMVLESNKAWHVGTANPYTIGIEHEGYVSNAAWYTNAMYQSSANLVKEITQSGYGINPLRTYDGTSSSSGQVLGDCLKIKGHQHYANQTHTDPGINWNWPKYYLLINNNYTPTVITNASGNLYDSGGANGNYGNDERKVWVIQPSNAASVQLTFSAFNTQTGKDKVLIYDGASTNAPLIGSYSGTTLPPVIQSTNPALTLEFRSDCGTTQSGWSASYTSNAQLNDVTPPISSVSLPLAWHTQDFTAGLVSTDPASGVAYSFYNVSSRSNANNPKYSNKSYGFFREEFSGTAFQWTNQTGSFQIGNGIFSMNDASQNNSNAYAQLTQNQQETYLYTWRQRITSTNANQRAGMHFFCSDPTLANRGNSYFVFFREETDKVQIYEVNNDVFTMQYEAPITLVPNQWYTIKVIYSHSSGNIVVYVNNNLVATWHDNSPLAQGNSISLRSGACTVDFDNIYVYKAHANQELVSIGSNKEIEHQSDQQQPSGFIRMMAMDSSDNWSSAIEQTVQVDWSPPVFALCNDGPGNDVDSFYTSALKTNWSTSDPHSGVSFYELSLGTSPGNSSVLNWMNMSTSTSYTYNLTSPIHGTVYFGNVKSTNTAGLTGTQSTDGQKYLSQANMQLPESPNPLAQILLYPNPNDGKQLFLKNLPFAVGLQLYDAQGKLILSKEPAFHNHVEISVAQGVYTLQLSGEGAQLNLRLVVQ